MKYFNDALEITFSGHHSLGSYNQLTSAPSQHRNVIVFSRQTLLRLSVFNTEYENQINSGFDRSTIFVLPIFKYQFIKMRCPVPASK